MADFSVRIQAPMKRGWNKIERGDSLVFADEMFSLAEGLSQRDQFSIGEQIRRAAPTN